MTDVCLTLLSFVIAMVGSSLITASGTILIVVGLRKHKR